MLSVYFWLVRQQSSQLGPRLLMTSITAHLTALAHSSCKQWVLKADVQASTGDADVCRQTCSTSVCKKVEVEEVCTMLLQCSQCSQLQSPVKLFELVRELMILAGMFLENSREMLPFHPDFINTDSHIFLLLFLTTTRASVRCLSIVPSRCPPDAASSMSTEGTSLTLYAATLLSHFMN